MSDAIPISREVYLAHHGWSETPRGWVKKGGFGKPLPADSAYELQAILDAIDNEVDCDCGKCLDCDARGYHADCARTNAGAAQ